MSWVYTYQMQADPYDFCYDGENCSRWRKTDGPGLVTFTDITDPASDAGFSVYGCYTFEWIECNPACADTDQVMICVLEEPIAMTTVTADTAECDDECFDLSNFGVVKYLYQDAPNVSWDNAHWVQIDGPGTDSLMPQILPRTFVLMLTDSTPSLGLRSMILLMENASVRILLTWNSSSSKSQLLMQAMVAKFAEHASH
jgi:hypothetical protein